MSHSVTSISPNKGTNDVDTSISILGSEFVGPATVDIGDTPAINVVVVNSSLITCDVPDGIDPGIYDVTVTDNGEELVTENAYRVLLPTPAYPFSDETETTIINRMLANSEATWDKREGSFFRDFLQASAHELARFFRSSDAFYLNIFAQYMGGTFLDLRAEEFGVIRNAAVKATGQVTFTGVNGTSIPIGARVSTVVDLNSLEDAILFETTEAVIIAGGTATADIIAVTGGEDGNVEADMITQLVTGITGVTSLTNASPTTGGVDRESDTDFRERFLRAVRNPVAGGNKADYETWALEVDGVGGVAVIPLQSGPGTVGVLILDADGNPAGAGLISDVQDYIDPDPGMGEGKAPIGAEVTVDAPAGINIDVVATIVLMSGADEPTVEAAAIAAVETYIRELPIGEDVLYSGVANAIYDTPGVRYWSGLTVNAGTANIAIAEDEKAIPNDITIAV